MCLGLVILRQPRGSPVRPFLGTVARSGLGPAVLAVGAHQRRYRLQFAIGPEMRILPFAAATDSDPCYGPMSRTGMTKIVNLATCWVTKAAARAGKHVLELCRTRRSPYEQTNVHNGGCFVCRECILRLSGAGFPSGAHVGIGEPLHN